MLRIGQELLKYDEGDAATDGATGGDSVKVNTTTIDTIRKTLQLIQNSVTEAEESVSNAIQFNDTLFANSEISKLGESMRSTIEATALDLDLVKEGRDEVSTRANQLKAGIVQIADALDKLQSEAQENEEDFIMTFEQHKSLQQYLGKAAVYQSTASHVKLDFTNLKMRSEGITQRIQGYLPRSTESDAVSNANAADLVREEQMSSVFEAAGGGGGGGGASASAPAGAALEQGVDVTIAEAALPPPPARKKKKKEKGETIPRRTRE
jgi:hypothetical protein